MYAAAASHKQRVTDHGEERVVRQVEEEAFAALHEHVMRIVHDAPELLDGCPRLVVEFKALNDFVDDVGCREGVLPRSGGFVSVLPQR